MKVSKKAKALVDALTSAACATELAATDLTNEDQIQLTSKEYDNAEQALLQYIYELESQTR